MTRTPGPSPPALLGHLAEAGAEVEVETNGTYLPTDVSLHGVTRFVVSPKLAHSGAPAWVRLKPEVTPRSLRSGTGK